MRLSLTRARHEAAAHLEFTQHLVDELVIHLRGNESAEQLEQLARGRTRGEHAQQ